MKKFSDKITLTRNSRGLWYIDPLLGCSHGKLNNGKGCYGVCYASNALKCRGYDFDNPIKRYFKSEKHFETIAKKLQYLPFVRIGVNCDPSDDWEHSIDIIKTIRPVNKNIVIVTKHWNELNETQIEVLSGLYINTSICILDTPEEIKHRLYWYNRLKKNCKSILRVNTFESFDKDINTKQLELLENDNVIDNVLRFKQKNIEGVKLQKLKFIESCCYVSKLRKESYFGDCYGCPDLCGVKMFKNCELKKPITQSSLLEFI